MSTLAARPGSRERRNVATALGLAMGPVIALGLARFAYALLLPPMRADLGWSFAVAGAMNTANAVGYLAGALLASPVARRTGSRRAFVAGLGLTTLALLACAASGNIVVLLALRVVAGAAGAVSFVTGAGLVAQLGRTASPGRATLLLGVYFAGGGAGIVISGLVIPPLLAHTTSGFGWRGGWLLLGTLALLALGAALPAARRAPEPPPVHSPRDRWPSGSLRALRLGYLLFGAGYIAYVTFIVAFLKTAGASSGMITAFWVVLGAAAIAATFAWAPALSRLPGGRGPAAVLALTTLGALLPLLSRAGWVSYLSAVLFGASFLSVVTAVTAVARASLAPRHWTPAIGSLTVAFALGQCLGPVASGVLSDGPGGVRAGLTLSVAILAAATVTCLAHRRRADVA